MTLIFIINKNLKWFLWLRNTCRSHRIESLNAWMVCCGAQDQQGPVFAICDDCGTVTEPIDIDFKNSLAGLSAKTGFELSHSVLEIRGRFSDCSTGLPNN